MIVTENRTESGCAAPWFRRASGIAASILALAIAPGAAADELLLDAPSATDVAMGAVAQEGQEKEWKSRFDFGGATAFGNSDNQSFTLGVATKRETEKVRTIGDARYYYSASDGDRDTNRFSAGLLHEWLNPESPWLYFVSGRFDYDEFESWEYRVGLHGGVGYELVKKDNYWLTLRGGLGALKEFNSDDEDWRAEALIGFDMGWQITEKQSFEAGSILYPDLSDGGEFRSVTYARWAVLVDDESNMSLTAGLENEYQSMVDPGFDHNDFRFRAGLSFDF